MERKGTASFGSIVAIIGAVLIGCGVAWLIAQNWHVMSSFVKILILAVATGGSLYAGIVLREKDYNGIAISLFMLGAMLYTLSIFLIAQIFSTDSSLQGTSWLLLLAWAGVAAIAYLFIVQGMLLIALIEILVWMVTQFGALSEHAGEFSFGVLALCFLAMGLFFYGLSLAHKNHLFERTYHYFSALYLLLFAYILSFQLVIPELWRTKGGASSTTLFLLAIAVIAVVALVVGILKKEWDKKELIGVGAIILLLGTVIVMSLLPSTVAQQQDIGGYCNQKNCFDYTTLETCGQADPGVQCKWNGNFCVQANCYTHQTRDACVAEAPCIWKTQQTSITEEHCDTNGCKNSLVDQTNYSNCDFPQGKNPKLNPPADSPINCYTLGNKDSCEKNTECKWMSSTYYGGWNGKMTLFTPLWFVWIWANIVLLAAILAVIFYGTWRKHTLLINLGMLFFGLMIVSRYIGFIIDITGYTSLSILFIIGGLILIGGGYFLEKWRRKLVNDAVEEKPAGKQANKPAGRTATPKKKGGA